MDINEHLCDRADLFLHDIQKVTGLYDRLKGISRSLNCVTKSLQRRENGKYMTLTEEEKQDFFSAVNAASDSFKAARGVMRTFKNFGRSTRGLGAALFNALSEFNRRLVWAGGTVPYEPLCDYTAGEFLQDCTDIHGRTKMMRLKKAVQVLEKLRSARASMHSKYSKLQQRLPRAGSPGEKAAAKNLIAKFRETETTLNRRALIVTSFFYKERLGMLKEVLEATTSVTSEDRARDASVKYDAKRVLEDIISADLKARKEIIK